MTLNPTRKAMRLFVGLLIILFFSGSTVDSIESKITPIGLVQQMCEWGMKIYNVVETYKNPDESRKNIIHIMKQQEDISHKLDALDIHLDIKLDAVLNTLLADIEIQGNFLLLKENIHYCLTKIDHYFDKSRSYKFNGLLSNQTLKDFAQKALWSSSSVPDLLEDLYGSFFPTGSLEGGLLSFIIQNANLNLLHECDIFASPQQNIYYLYIQLIMSEIKGLLVQQYCYMLKRLFDDSSHDYVAELKIVKNYTELRLRAYEQLFCSIINQLPQHLRRCDAYAPQRGVHFVEMQKFSQIVIFDPFLIHYRICGRCPLQPAIDAASIRMNATISDCRQMGKAITTCPAQSGSHREILWWEDSKGNHYGPNVSCIQKALRKGAFREGYGLRGSYFYMNCQLCTCSVEMNHDGKEKSIRIWRISTTEQTSDYRNNKVITGIKFVTCNNTLHLQIKQAEFSQSGLHYENNEWKALDIGYYNRSINHVRRPIISVPLRHDRKSVYLDDISAPEGYAVTGVRFQLVNDLAFKLQISVAEFDIMSGLIHPSSNSWIDASTNPTRPDDYKKERSEINMGASDDPTRGSEFKYNFESNQLIKFTHTDINKDGGQTTIPLLEAQAVETNPAFPLSGIGLTFKGREHYGGYITPRIYTLDVTKYMRSSQNEKVQPNQELNITDYVIHTLDGKVYFASDYDRYTIDKFNTSSMIVKGQD